MFADYTSCAGPGRFRRYSVPRKCTVRGSNKRGMGTFVRRKRCLQKVKYNSDPGYFSVTQSTCDTTNLNTSGLLLFDCRGRGELEFFSFYHVCEHITFSQFCFWMEFHGYTSSLRIFFLVGKNAYECNSSKTRQ